jgi:hypothetical protein
MLLDYNKFRPVKKAGFLFILIAIFGLFCLLAFLKESGFRELIIIVTAWNLLTGLGIIFRTTWGYYLFKIYLYIMFICFPIGTYIAYKSLNYLKENQIERFFDKKAIEI